jgi:hypothetical protein
MGVGEGYGDPFIRMAPSEGGSWRHKREGCHQPVTTGHGEERVAKRKKREKQIEKEKVTQIHGPEGVSGLD